MAKKDGFNFDTGSKPGFSLDFLKNLTKKQKEIILIAVISVVVVAIIITVGILVASSGTGNGGVLGGIFGGGSSEDGEGAGGGGDDESKMPTQILEFHVAAPPTETVYYVGEEINYDGLFFYFRNSDDRSEHIYYSDSPGDFTITGFDSSAPAEKQIITVECKGFTDTFTVTILEIPVVPPTLVRIYLDENNMPQTTYTLEDAFVFKGAKFMAEYSDGTVEIIKLTMGHLEGFGDIESLGEHEILVRYFDDRGGYAETSFTVTITE